MALFPGIMINYVRTLLSKSKQRFFFTGIDVYCVYLSVLPNNFTSIIMSDLTEYFLCNIVVSTGLIIIKVLIIVQNLVIHANEIIGLTIQLITK